MLTLDIQKTVVARPSRIKDTIYTAVLGASVGKGRGAATVTDAELHSDFLLMQYSTELTL